MSRKFLCLLGTGALIAFTGVRAQATLVVSSQFNLLANADADTNDPSAAQSAAYSDSQFGTTNPYAGSVAVTSTEASDGGTATAMSAAGATWAGADSGAVIISNTGWSVATLDASGVSLNTAAGFAPVWEYVFTATANGSFNMSYNVTASGDTFGLQGVYFGWSGPGGGLDVTNSSDPTASGLFSRSLVSGQTYTVDVYNYPNVSSNGGFNLTGSMNAGFQWNITQSSVPEPFTLALGLGGLALALRRRLRK